jgi:sodium-dependent dicarboxylate transporter 2/3/5
MERNGVGLWLAGAAGGLEGVPPMLVVLGVTAGMVFLTELTSNTATTAALVPVLAAVGPSLGLDPMALALPATIGASCAFMLPAATPPNAIVFGSGEVTLRQMARAGLWLNLVAIALVVVGTYAIGLPLLGAGAIGGR